MMSLHLTFHGIGDVARPLTPEEQRIWCTVKQADDILDIVAGRSDVHISVDDGNRSDVELLAPALIKRGLRADFFILAGRLGMPEFLSDSDVRELHNMGMGIGTHGWDHVAWRHLSKEQAHREMHESCKRLESCGIPPIQAAACPFGAYHRRTIRQLKQAGITNIYTSDGGWCRSGGLVVPRNSIGQARGAAWVAKLVQTPEVGFLRRLKRGIKRRR